MWVQWAYLTTSTELQKHATTDDNWTVFSGHTLLMGYYNNIMGYSITFCSCLVYLQDLVIVASTRCTPMKSLRDMWHIPFVGGLGWQQMLWCGHKPHPTTEHTIRLGNKFLTCSIDGYVTQSLLPADWQGDVPARVGDIVWIVEPAAALQRKAVDFWESTGIDVLWTFTDSLSAKERHASTALVRHVLCVLVSMPFILLQSHMLFIRTKHGLFQDFTPGGQTGTVQRGGCHST